MEQRREESGTIQRAGTALGWRGLEPAEETRGIAVLCHPLTASAAAWNALNLPAELQHAGIRCVMPDSLAHGRSAASESEARCSLAEQVADVMAVLDALGIDRFVAAGYSMGAWLAAGLLALHPDRIAGLSMGGWDPIDGARLFTSEQSMPGRQREWERRLELAVAQRGERDPLRRADRPSLWWCYRQLFEALPSMEQLSRPGVPIQVLCAIGDPYYDNAVRAAGGLGAEFVPLTGDHASGFFDPQYARRTTEFITATCRRAGV